MAEIQENPHLIDLYDEDGNKVVFEHLDTVKYQDREFVICIPYDDDEEEVTEVVIFRIDEDEEGEEILSQIFEPDIMAPVTKYSESVTRKCLNLKNNKGQTLAYFTKNYGECFTRCFFMAKKREGENLQKYNLILNLC